MTTKKPKELFKKILKTRLCQFEDREELLEELIRSLKEHYHTIFGELDDMDMDFVFNEQGELMLRIYDIDEHYDIKMKKIVDHVHLKDANEWCLETFINEFCNND